MDKKLKVLYLVPHLSTGGMPQYVYYLINQLIDKNIDVFIVEFSDIAPSYIVQKNLIKEKIGDKLFTLCGKDKKKKLFDIIKKIKPDIVHLQEVPEMWLPEDVSMCLYSNDRQYKIIETSHDASFDPNSKRFFPDSFAFISEYHPSIYKKYNIPYEIVEYPIEYHDRPDRDKVLSRIGLDPEYKHILNVGLFTPRKNQAEIFKIAKQMEGEKIMFHFIGNQADNFKWYWEPLMKNVPNNCHVWGERSDIDKFYSCMDLFLFTSKGTKKDRETNPLVIKEALGWNLPICMYNLPVYMGVYNDNKNITFLSGDIEKDMEKVRSVLSNSEKNIFSVDLKYDGNENKIWFLFNVFEDIDVICNIKDLDTNLPMYSFDLTLFDGLRYWCELIQTQYFKFDELEGFNGFTVDFYNKNKDLILSKELRINNYEPKCNIKFKTDPFDGLWYNYGEFFYKDIYKNVKIKNGATILDIGANSGIFIGYVKCRGAGKIYAVEPIEKAANNIIDTFPDVTVIKKALDSQEGEKTIYTNLTNTTISSFFKEKIDPNFSKNLISQNIKTTTIQQIVQDYNISHIDLMKMDIEGAEYDVWETIDIDFLNMVDSIILEFHHNDDGKKIKSITKKMKEAGFVYSIKAQSSNKIEIDESSSEGWIYAKKTIFPEEAFVLHSDESFLPIVEYTIKSIRLYSKKDIILYTINCDADFNYPELTKIRIDNEDIKNNIDSKIYMLASLKTSVILDALDRGLKVGVYLDADILANYNIDDLFDYKDMIDNYPLATEGVYEIMIKDHNEIGGEEKALMKKMEVKNASRTWYCQTNVFIFNDKCYDFIKEWQKICFDSEVIEKWQEMAYFYEETSYNILLWKYGYVNKLPQSFLNIVNTDTLVYFFKVDGGVNYNDNMKRTPINIHGLPGDGYWQSFPKDKNMVKVFHGVKKIDDLEDIYQYLKGFPKKVLVNFFDDKKDIKVEYCPIIDLPDKSFVSLREKDTGLLIYKNQVGKYKKGIKYWVSSTANKESLSGIIFEIRDENGNILYEEEKEYGKKNSIIINNKEISIFGIEDDISWNVFYEIFYKKDYDYPNCSVSKGDICVDLGANYGFFSLYALQKGASKVYAVEPFKKTFKCMQKNIDSFDNVVSINKALGEKSGQGEMFFYDRTSSCVFSSDEKSVKRGYVSSEKIDVMSFSDFVQEYSIDKIDFLKIDVEGSEYNIINGIDEEFLCNNIQKIAGEYHSNFNGELNKIVYKLEKCGFIVATELIYPDTGIGYFYAYKKSVTSILKLNIAQIATGLISIPPNGWGAIEKIIWNYKLGMERLGHTVDIISHNDIPNLEPGQYDIIHSHIADQALKCKKYNVPYIFTCHDHHVILNGEGSLNYNQNMEAVKGATSSIFPSEQFIEYVKNDKIQYIPHGVDLNFYNVCNHSKDRKKKILCIGYNGTLIDPIFDRKGFSYAIEAARELDIPITIAGPKHNIRFFDANPHLKWDKLDLQYDLNDEQLRNLYQTHFALVHVTSIEAGHPPLTPLEAMACGLPVIGSFMGNNFIHSSLLVERDSKQIKRAIRTLFKHYDYFVKEARLKAELYPWDMVIDMLCQIYQEKR